MLLNGITSSCCARFSFRRTRLARINDHSQPLSFSLHIAAIATALLPSSCALSGKARAEAASLKIVHVKAAAKVQASDSYLWWPPCLLFMLLLPCHKLTRTHSLLYFAPNHIYLYTYISISQHVCSTHAPDHYVQYKP